MLFSIILILTNLYYERLCHRNEVLKRFHLSILFFWLRLLLFSFQNLQLIGSFATCEKFWQIFCHLVRPGELTNHCDFHLFKKGIKPLWEDEANRYGGKFLKCFEIGDWFSKFATDKWPFYDHFWTFFCLYLKKLKFSW